MWKDFLRTETSVRDPLLRGYLEDDKSSLISLFLRQRHEEGFRAKGATAVTAGVRMQFAQALQSTTFLDSSVIATARQSCRLTPDELRVRRDSGAANTVKLPACEGMLAHMRGRLWDGQLWSSKGLKDRMVYIACIFAYDMSARISEYTIPEPRAVDHCARVNDLTFYSQTPNGVIGSSGSTLARELIGVSDDHLFVKRVLECRVQTASSKGKAVIKPKLIGRRSVAESQLLNDLVLWVVRSGACGTDELFSIREASRQKISLRGRTVRDEIKITCRALNLPPNYFSSHSLRKGGITHMRASGATEDDRRDRGNYAPGSQVMNSTYDYATGMGPLAANCILGGYQPTISDVQRLLPIERDTTSRDA
jgi:hypothetical protein